MKETERVMLGTVTTPNDWLHGTISTFNMPLKSGKSIQFKVDEHGNIAVYEWNPDEKVWTPIWRRTIYMPKE